MLPLEHSAILSTYIKLPFSIKTLLLSIFKWPLKTGFTVYNVQITEVPPVALLPDHLDIYKWIEANFLSSNWFLLHVNKNNHSIEMVLLINNDLYFDCGLENKKIIKINIYFSGVWQWHK